jgi:hypothetical protein
MELFLGFSLIAFVVIVVTDTLQKRRQNTSKNR